MISSKTQPTNASARHTPALMESASRAKTSRSISCRIKCLLLPCLLTGLYASSDAKPTGFFVSGGVGIAQTKTSAFNVYNTNFGSTINPGEYLQAKDRSDRSAVGRLTIGYTFPENWDLRLSCIKTGAAQVTLPFPTIRDEVWAQVIGAGPDRYSRHILEYDTTSLALQPVYAFGVSERLRIKAGAGLLFTLTRSHFEDTYLAGGVLSPPPVQQDHSYAKRTTSSIGLTGLVGASYEILPNLNLELACHYSKFKTGFAKSRWGTQPEPKAKLQSLNTELSVLFYW